MVCHDSRASLLFAFGVVPVMLCAYYEDYADLLEGSDTFTCRSAENRERPRLPSTIDYWPVTADDAFPTLFGGGGM